jgi:hypothetical protein
MVGRAREQPAGGDRIAAPQLLPPRAALPRDQLLVVIDQRGEGGVSGRIDHQIEQRPRSLVEHLAGALEIDAHEPEAIALALREPHVRRERRIHEHERLAAPGIERDDDPRGAGGELDRREVAAALDEDPPAVGRPVQTLGARLEELSPLAGRGGENPNRALVHLGPVQVRDPGAVGGELRLAKGGAGEKVLAGQQRGARERAVRPGERSEISLALRGGGARTEADNGQQRGRAEVPAGHGDSV